MTAFEKTQRRAMERYLQGLDIDLQEEKSGGNREYVVNAILGEMDIAKNLMGMKISVRVDVPANKTYVEAKEAMDEGLPF